MRAINCTQCGATIDNVSENSVILHCNYCGARIMLEPRQVEAKPPPVAAPDFEVTSPSVSFGKVAILLGAIILIPVFVVFVLVNQPAPSTPAKAYSAPSY